MTAVERWTVDRHLYITEDGSHVVEEGDPAGRWLWAGPGKEVPLAEALRLDAVKPERPETEPEPKRRGRPPGNKMRMKPADKGI